MFPVVWVLGRVGEDDRVGIPNAELAVYVRLFFVVTDDVALSVMATLAVNVLVPQAGFCW